MEMLRRYRASLDPLRSQPDYGEGENSNPYARTASQNGVSYGCLMAVCPDNLNMLMRQCGEMVPASARLLDEDHTNEGISDQAHVTIKYGVVAQTDEVVSWVSEHVKPFSFRFIGADVFKNEGSWVLVIKCENDVLGKINNEFSQAIPHVDDTFGSYTPHMTICYVKPDTDLENVLYRCNEIFSGMECQISKLEYSSADDNTVTVSI